MDMLGIKLCLIIMDKLGLKNEFGNIFLKILKREYDMQKTVLYNNNS